MSDERGGVVRCHANNNHNNTLSHSLLLTIYSFYLPTLSSSSPTNSNSGAPQSPPPSVSALLSSEVVLCCVVLGILRGPAAMSSSAAAVVGASPKLITSHFFSSSNPKPSPSSAISLQKSAFQGLSLQESTRGATLFLPPINQLPTRARGRAGLQVTARTAGAAKNIEVEVDKPLGLTLGQKPGGGVLITAVDGGGNAARAGLKSGDQVLYTSSFFGDELWPADKLGFTKTAIQAKPDSVYFVVSRGAEVDVKRLPKRPAPPRFGRKLTEAQKAKATHICIDCGYIYTLQKPFDEQPDTYGCPQCQAPKKRFAKYDVNTGKAIGGGLPPIGVLIGLAAGLGAVGALLVYGLQ